MKLEASIDATLARVQSATADRLTDWAQTEAADIAQELKDGKTPKVIMNGLHKMDADETHDLLLALRGALSDADYGEILAAGYGMPNN